MLSYRYNLSITLLFIVIIAFLFYTTLYLNVEAKDNEFENLNFSIKDFDKFKEYSCSMPIKSFLSNSSNSFYTYFRQAMIKDNISIDYSLNKYNELTLIPILQKYNLNNEINKIDWYVQEKPSCSGIRLYDLEELKRNGINILDFRDSRLGELAPKGAPSQQCLVCTNCIDAYLLILTDDKLSKSKLENLGFKQIDNIEKYIDRIKYGK